MWLDYEVELDKGNTRLVADIKVTDESYDDVLGTCRVTGLKIENFRVMSCIDGHDYDVTIALSVVDLKTLEDKFTDQAYADVEYYKLVERS